MAFVDYSEYSQEDSEDSEDKDFLVSDSDYEYDDNDRPYEQDSDEESEGESGEESCGDGGDPLHELESTMNFNQPKNYGTLPGDCIRRRRRPSLRGGLREEIPVPVSIYNLYRNDPEHRQFLKEEFGDGIQYLSSDSEGEP